METVQFKFGLGEVLKDIITGIEGVVMVRAEYSTKCVHYGLCPKDVKEFKDPNWVWVDEIRLKRTKKKRIQFEPRESMEVNTEPAKTNGPQPKGPSM